MTRETEALLAAVLSTAHLEMLRDESGISDAVIEARGYRTITDHNELTALGFSSRQLHVPGVLHLEEGADK